MGWWCTVCFVMVISLVGDAGKHRIGFGSARLVVDLGASRVLVLGEGPGRMDEGVVI